VAGRNALQHLAHRSVRVTRTGRRGTRWRAGWQHIGAIQKHQFGAQLRQPM
jgi:hypothetical protein